jgi:RimJ/RimL family protein N-acetyltransferase
MAVPMILEGPRLRLRPWRAEDRAPLAAINADAAVMRHFPKPMSRAESDAWLDGIEAHFARHGWGFWAVERTAEPGLIGVVGLMTIPWQADFTPAVEIGWRIASAHQRQGYAEEAARMSLAAGFGTIGLGEILAFAVPSNAPSWLLMAKLGMRPAGTFEHPRLPDDHPLRLHVLYRMSRQAWMGQARPERLTG